MSTTGHSRPAKRLFSAAMIVALLASTGCASMTRSDYRAPELSAAPAWSTQPSGAWIAQEGRWWDQFGDARLSELVERVLAVNGDLAVAGIRLKQARLSADLAASQLGPTFSGSLSTGASRPLESGNRWSESASASLGVSWELDLFGKLGAQRDAAAWEAAASEQDLAATRLSLVGTTVMTWWQLAYANERIAMGEESLSYTARALQLVQIQYNAGAVSRVELRDAEQSVAAQEAALAQLYVARSEGRNALAALLGRQDYDGFEPTVLPTTALPTVDAGLPADLLARRPDLAASELRLRKMLASTDATVASFYPDLSLTGALGTASEALLGFFFNPAASLGATLSLPFLNPERVRLNVGIARADYDLAVAQFRQDFTNALRDTADALYLRENLILQGHAQERNYRAAQDAEGLYERQYRAGATTLRNWLDAQERLRNARTSLIENRLNQLNAQVALYQALGGDAAIPQ